jgi:RNA polymerase sigma-70 factor (ECF subfamily)
MFRGDIRQMSDSSKDYEKYIAPIQHRMVDSVWRIVRDPEETKDVVQDVLAKIVRQMRRIRIHANPTALILRMCVNEAISQIRRARRQRGFHELVKSEYSLHSRVASPEDIVGRAEQQGQVLQALRRLPRREAEAMVLFAVEELTYAEIAAAMRCRESTVRVLVARARGRLRREFHCSRTSLSLEVERT